MTLNLIVAREQRNIPQTDLPKILRGLCKKNISAITFAKLSIIVMSSNTYKRTLETVGYVKYHD